MKFICIILFTGFLHSGFGQIIGSSVSFPGTDGKNYSGVIKEQKGNAYLVKYDGYDFEAWLVSEQFSIVATPTAEHIATDAHSEITAILNFGKQYGWASQIQENKLGSYLSGLTSQDKSNLTGFLNQAKTKSAKFFALKSLLAGDNFDVLQKFITQLNAYPESYQQEKCLVTSSRSIIQQWQYSCSVTTVQTYLGDLCPRYAWEVKQIGNYDVIANDPDHPMAQQQKELLEKYGGSATARGDYTGISIGINEPLNDFVGKILGLTFYAQQVDEPLPAIFTKIRRQLDRGINVPMLIGFEGADGKHFVLLMKYRTYGNTYQYLIYDPWEGRSELVTQTNMEAHSMAPLQRSFRISIDYYYPTYE